MTNIRQVANVSKDGSNLTLVNVVVTTTDPDTGHVVKRIKPVGVVYTTINDLYAAIKDNVNEVLTSGL